MVTLASSKTRVKERRRHQRLPLSIPLFVRGSDDHGKQFLEFATVLNISASGALLAMSRNVALATKVLLEIPVVPFAAADLRPLSVRRLRATVVRVAHGARAHSIGLKFQRPLPV